MNIEESSFEAALMQALPWIISVHLSDNNRYFPGFGAIDFGEICAFLSQIGFSGGLAIEGEVKSDVVSDLTASVAYLESV
jgi:sugar phosphate isomerase/epimerase